MTHHRTLRLAVAAAVLLAAPAHAQREVNQRRDASPTGRVEIQLHAGTVRVVGWSRGQVQVTGTLAGRDELQLEGSGRTVEVGVDPAGRRAGPATLEVRVPAGSTVSVSSGGSVTVSGVTGAVEAESRSGPVTVQGSPRTVEATAHSGPVTVEGRADRVEVTAMSGPVRIAADVRQRVDITAMSGPVDVLGAVGEVEISALSGDVRVANATGRVEVDGVSGNVTVNGSRMRGNVNTVSGNILVSGSLGGAMSMETHGGNVEWRVPSGTSAEVEVATFNGGFRSDFGNGSRESHNERRLSIGRGGPAVSISTFSGDVKLSRR